MSERRLPPAGAQVSDAPAPAPPRPRIWGVDAARALAIIGMFAVHIGPTDVASTAGRIYALSHGRAAILFVLVAGVGVSLLAGARSASLAQTRGKLVWRAALLLPLGLWLQGLDHRVLVVLQTYAALFLVAVLVVSLADRWLLTLAAGSAVLGPLGFWWGVLHAPAVFDRGPIGLGDPAGEILHGLVLSGPYPLITWAAPFLLGIWLGRQDLRSPQLARTLVLVGGLVGIASAAAARLLVALLGDPGQAATWRRLITDQPHSQTPLWLLGAAGIALLVLGAALLLAALWPRVFAPLVATGQLALTIYVGHLLILHTAPETLTSARVGEAALLLAGFTLAAITAAALWRMLAPRGPLEGVLNAPWWLAARLRARAR